jgi:hypothetical protein
MGFPIRVLIVEDESERAERLRRACVGALEREVEVEVAPDAAAGAASLAQREFDLVVDDASDGLALFHAAADEHPGVPVVVLSDLGTPAIVNELLAEARRADLFGLDDERPMVSFHSHDDLDGCAGAIETLVRATAEVAAIPIEADGPLELSTSEARALQIFARRTGAARARASGLGGGLSGAKTVVLDAEDQTGMKTAHVVGKLSHVSAIPGGVEGYENAIPYLPAGLGAALAGVVNAGAGDTGAAFYRLADDYRRTWFECLAQAPGDAAHAARRLHDRFADRYLDDPHERRTVGDVRRSIWSDEEMSEAVADPPDIGAVESVEIEVSRAIQHRDLHGMNLLVSDSNEPLLIDYDNYAPANCALDPITLELSAIFHRDEGAQSARGAWPSVEQAARWPDLDAYLEGCPYPEAIRACRAWAEDAAAAQQEIWATLVGSAIRQFWFDNTDKELAGALVQAGAAKLS